MKRNLRKAYKRRLKIASAAVDLLHVDNEIEKVLDSDDTFISSEVRQDLEAIQVTLRDTLRKLRKAGEL